MQRYHFQRWRLKLLQSLCTEDEVSQPLVVGGAQLVQASAGLETRKECLQRGALTSDNTGRVQNIVSIQIGDYH